MACPLPFSCLAPSCPLLFPHTLAPGSRTHYTSAPCQRLPALLLCFFLGGLQSFSALGNVSQSAKKWPFDKRSSRENLCWQVRSSAGQWEVRGGQLGATQEYFPSWEGRGAGEEIPLPFHSPPARDCCESTQCPKLWQLPPFHMKEWTHGRQAKSPKTAEERDGKDSTASVSAWNTLGPAISGLLKLSLD